MTLLAESALARLCRWPAGGGRAGLLSAVIAVEKLTSFGRRVSSAIGGVFVIGAFLEVFR